MSATLSAAERLEIERACERLILSLLARAGRGRHERRRGLLRRARHFLAAHGARPAHRRPRGRARLAAVAAEDAADPAPQHQHDDRRGEPRCRERTVLPHHGLHHAGGRRGPAACLARAPIWFGEMRDRFVRENGVWKFQERRGSIQMKFGRCAMSRPHRSSALIAALLLALCGRAACAATQPNILLILIDDLGAESSSLYSAGRRQAARPPCPTSRSWPRRAWYSRTPG